MSSSSCNFLWIVALWFSKISYHKKVIFKCHLLLIYILLNCFNTYYFKIYIYSFDSTIILLVNISRSDCSLYCSFIYHSTCNPINSTVHNIKCIYFCTLYFSNVILDSWSSYGNLILVFYHIKHVNLNFMSQSLMAEYT